MSSDLTVKILEKIHEEIRGQREDHRGLVSIVSTMSDRIEMMNTTMNARFEILETTLRDLAQQLVMLTRGVKVAI